MQRLRLAIEHVIKLKQSGMSYMQIGAELGISRQAAQAADFNAETNLMYVCVWCHATLEKRRAIVKPIRLGNYLLDSTTQPEHHVSGGGRFLSSMNTTIRQ